MSTEVQNKNANTRAPGSASTGPERGGIILTSLILVAAVANLNLSVANVALPNWIGVPSSPGFPLVNIFAGVVGVAVLVVTTVWGATLRGGRYLRRGAILLGRELWRGRRRDVFARLLQRCRADANLYRAIRFLRRPARSVDRIAGDGRLSLRPVEASTSQGEAAAFGVKSSLVTGHWSLARCP